MAQDFLGNDILPGDVVVYLNHYKTSSELKVGVVEKSHGENGDHRRKSG